MEEKDKNLDDSFLFNEEKQPEFGDSLFQEQPQIADEFSFLDNFCILWDGFYRLGRDYFFVYGYNLRYSCLFRLFRLF